MKLSSSFPQAYQGITEKKNGLGNAEVEAFINSIPKGEFDALLLAMKTKKTEIERIYKAEIRAANKQIKQIIETITAPEFRELDLDEKKIVRDKRIALEASILGYENNIHALQNGGDVISSMEDKKGRRYTEFPDFSGIETTFEPFDAKTILKIPKPIFVPKINEDIFASKGYMFEVLRIANDSYLMSTNGYKDKAAKENHFIVVTLDQLALISEYYFTKAKAKAQERADDRNRRQKEGYFKRGENWRHNWYSINVKYRDISAKDKKEISEEEWNELSIADKEQIYQPIPRHGPKRLTSKLESNKMWRSYHNMYEAFINPAVKVNEKREGDPEVFEYYYAFRDFLKWKIKDIKVVRQTDSETRKKAIETSFGKSGTNDFLYKDFGVLVKRQNGKVINAVETDEIQNALKDCLSLYGDFRPWLKREDIVVSHASDKYIYASKAIGVYIPRMNAIGVSSKGGESAFKSTMAHEIAHFLDNQLGKKEHKMFGSFSYESPAGKLAALFRKNMNKGAQNDYMESTHECFARAMQQYFIMELYPEVPLYNISFMDIELPYIVTKTKYFVNEDKYKTLIKPAVEAVLKEFDFPAFLKENQKSQEAPEIEAQRQRIRIMALRYKK